MSKGTTVEFAVKWHDDDCCWMMWIGDTWYDDEVFSSQAEALAFTKKYCRDMKRSEGSSSVISVHNKDGSLKDIVKI